jgi:HlyD family secretion protein
MKRIIPIVLLTILLFSGCGQSGKSSATDVPSQSASPSQEVYIMAGKIDARDQSAVTTKISAKVAQILVDVGSQVKQGDPVIILETNELRAQVNQAEAAVLTAQANLNNTLAGSRPEQIAQAQAALDSAQKNYENSKNNFNRMQDIYNLKGVSRQQFETAQTQLAAAEAQNKSAREQLDLLKQGATKETVAILEKQVQQARAALEVTKTQLNNGTIVAPLSGNVTAKNINVGELASPGDTLVSVVNNEALYVNAYLPASMSGQAKQGQPVIVKVSEIPGKKFDGEITVMNGVINSLSKNILVKVAFKIPDQALKPGMFAEIALKK